MNIKIPSKLTPLNVINFSNELWSCNPDQNYTYDFQNMQHCHPYGLLVLASVIRNNINRHPNSKHELIGTSATQGGEFAASFGLYQSIGKDIGLAKEEDDIGYRYIPIKKISAKDLHTRYSGTTLLNEKVNQHSAFLADILVGDQSQTVREAIQYCFREIMRNTFEHAHTDDLWVCGQYWPTRHEAEIAILDEGIGILKSLQSNPRIQVSSCAEANALAVQPGLSCTLGQKNDPYNMWQNSGYGLYVASTLCGINGGYFVLSSGDSALLINANEEHQYGCHQVGTAVCLNIRTDSRKLRDFDTTLAAVVAEGETKAQENGTKRILTASKVTTIASMIRHIEQSACYTAGIPEKSIGLVPINESVVFEAQSTNRQNEVVGIFTYNGKCFNGVLVNVSGFNKTRYVTEQMRISAIVRKYKNGIYTLLESHRYKKYLNKR